MGIAIVSLLVLVVVVVVAIPILARVFSEAMRRNPNRPGGEGDENIDERDRNSGPGRE